jgi:alkylation response protein AidB-like acyl-CoA dehydrogenase
MSHHRNSSNLPKILGNGALFNSLLPPTLGGDETNLLNFCKSVENIAQEDGSAAWCLMIGAVLNGAVAAYGSDEAVKTIFGKNSDDCIPSIFAGQTTPRAEIELVDNSLLLSGNFKFGSGIDHANWVLCGFIDPNDNEHYLAALPKENVVVSGDWDTFGLAGTGSQNYTINQQIIPKQYVFKHDTKTPLRGGKIFSCGLVSVMLTGHIGVALGLAQQALKILKDLTKINRRSGQLIEREDFLTDFGRHTANLLAAKAFTDQALHSLDVSASRGNIVQSEHDNIRMAAIHTTETSRSVVRFAFDYSGMHGITNESNLNRIFRDIHVASQHLLVNSSQYKVMIKRMIG